MVWGQLTRNTPVVIELNPLYIPFHLEVETFLYKVEIHRYIGAPNYLIKKH